MSPRILLNNLSAVENRGVTSDLYEMNEHRCGDSMKRIFFLTAVLGIVFGLMGGSVAHAEECDHVFDLEMIQNADVIFEGKVIKIMNFGAFVSLTPGRDGLVHISQLSQERVENVTDVVTEGEMVKVKVLEVDKQGRIRLSMKEVSADEAA